MSASPLTLEEIVENGLCIGCGLCRSIAGRDQIDFVMTPQGRERPLARRPLDRAALERINAVCPGTRIGGTDTASCDTAMHDPVWGPAERLSIAHASDPLVRFRGSSGGALTALGRFLLSSGRVNFILHVGASKSAPMRSERRLSFDAAAVLDGAGSRYGPAAVLIDFCEILERAEPFALIAKPCDVTAVRNLGRIDARVDRYMRYALTLVCGGASDLRKSEEVLQHFRIHESELALFRYRGHGNPGLTRVETKDGRAFELTYQQLWEDQSKWMIQPRCRICPDAIGVEADIAASDVWPGGSPAGEDAGFNGIIVRTARGLELYEAAVAAGALTIDHSATYADFDRFQPHQVRKRRAIWARLKALQATGKPVPQVTNLGLE
ncbi:MAG TPA: Coenzyme F420 hydrogenase/dehydrogenase, beta subunit C-terminal domain, partial [Steroidobacteraceae bacterium]|nr:Coenzyme F420 hydrogenase/dehydrogenase, beta subunit C-terminal domain [Steroidobacteraceae bacterium]